MNDFTLWFVHVVGSGVVHRDSIEGIKSIIFKVPVATFAPLLDRRVIIFLGEVYHIADRFLVHAVVFN